MSETTVSAFPAMYTTTSGKEGYFNDTYGNLHLANMMNLQSNQLVHADVLREGQENQRETLETKFQIERSAKDLEKSILENKFEAEKRFALIDVKIADEGRTTRDLIRDMDCKKKDEEIAALKAQILVLSPVPSALR